MTFLVEIVTRNGLGGIIKEECFTVESLSQEDLLKSEIYAKTGSYASKRKGSYSVTVTELGKAMTFDSNVPRDQEKYDSIIKASISDEQKHKKDMKNFKL